MLLIIETTENIIKTFLGSNIFVSFFNAHALQYLWGMVNAIQMIIMTSLFKISLPVNAFMVIQAIWHLVSLDVFQTDALYARMFGFRGTEAF